MYNYYELVELMPELPKDVLSDKCDRVLEMRELLRNAIYKAEKYDELVCYIGGDFLNGTWEYVKPSEALKEIARIENNIIYLLSECDINEEVNMNFTSIKENKSCEIIKRYILKAQEQEKENELLKEIIKSLFDKGSPLHQYVDKDFGLTIEVDDECSIMHLGEFKGVDLDKKLKEVLENE